MAAMDLKHLANTDGNRPCLLHALYGLPCFAFNCPWQAFYKGSLLYPPPQPQLIFKLTKHLEQLTRLQIRVLEEVPDHWISNKIHRLPYRCQISSNLTLFLS